MFKPVFPKVNFPEMEIEILKWWYDSGLVGKYLRKNSDSQNKFSFLDGPITANNPMGVHHAWGRTYKDLWQRFKNMQGFRERFQNGFDCQGLWVEVEVEKELGLHTKKDIENLVLGDRKASIAKFVQLCKDRVIKYSSIQTEQSKRLGYFMDWEHSYFTMSDDNNYMIWNFLKKCHEKGLIYKGHDSVPWCPRCGTAISQHEISTEEYKELVHDSVYIEYPIDDTKNEFLLAWTTTPWTLPGNVALAVDKNKEYVKAQSENGNTYYLLKSVAEKMGLKIVKTLKGADLVGLNYKSPFDELARIKESLKDFKHKVVATEETILPISDEEGTGIVHLAPGQGSEDFQLGKKYDLPVIELIDEEAGYLDKLGDFSGKNAKKHPELILEFLKQYKDGLFLFDVVSYKHRYPACWRCKTELVWRVVDEWYISIDPVREDMKKIAKEINWIPKFGMLRELDWLSNMHDWLISKKRYWGLALPIWKCNKCEHFEVIGGKEELKSKATRGWQEFEGHTPHRPFIDEVELKCEKCQGTMKRIPDVGNPWLDAGIVPFSTMTKDWFPADFITESFPGQFKNWFYALIAMSTVMENKIPAKTILGFATLLAENGEAMHKSLGNSIEFNEGADKIGADVMRWMYVTQNPAENLLFGYHKADEVRRRFHLLLWNIYNFFVTYANIDKFEIRNTKFETANVLDKWIISKLNGLIEEVTESLKKYDAQSASLKIENFVSDLSLWYVRRSRDRVGPAVENTADRNGFYQTMFEVLTTLSKLLAPFTPYLAEEIYKNLKSGESVHLTDWPKENASAIDKILEEEMVLARKICESGHAARKDKQIKVRQPLSKIKVKNLSLKNKDLERLILDELNVKQIEWVSGSGELEVELDTTITPLLQGEGEARELIRQIQELRKEAGCTLDEKVIVYAPSWPKEFEDYIRKETLAQQILNGPELKIEK